MPRRAAADEKTLLRVYRENIDSVFAFFAYSVDAPTAEDLTASTFERVIRSWSRFDPRRASERTWILAIARNLLTDHFRRQKHRQAVSTDEHPHVLDAHVSDPGQDRLDADELRSWLSRLGEREQQVLALRYGADLSAGDVGALLGLSPENVHQIASRALRRLRAEIGSERLSGSA